MVGKSTDTKPPTQENTTVLMQTGGPHDAAIPQQVADGGVAVIGHDCQQEKLYRAQEEVEIALGDTASKGDGFITRY